MIRVAAVGDLHLGPDSEESRSRYEDVSERADVFLLAGDLTKRGTEEEAKVVAREVGDLGVPTYAVLGNHDHHDGKPDLVSRVLEDAGIRVLEGESDVLDIRGVRVGIIGAKGFCGGFAGACGSDFGEQEMKEFILHTKSVAQGLQESISATDSEIKLVLLHYSPIRGTLHGERLEIYPFLGSYLLAEAIDHAGADLVVHGHAHAGTEKGLTPGGVHVRNVAQQVVQHPYALYNLHEELAASVDVAELEASR